MNIISGNRNVHGLPPFPPMPQNQNKNTDELRYYSSPQIYQPQMNCPPVDVQGLLNNMFMTLNNQSKLLNYLIEKNDHNFTTANKIYDEIITAKYHKGYLENKKQRKYNKREWTNLKKVTSIQK